MKSIRAEKDQFQTSAAKRDDLVYVITHDVFGKKRKTFSGDRRVIL